MALDRFSGDFMERRRQGLNAARAAIESVRAWRRQELESLINRRIEDVSDQDALFESLFDHNDAGIRGLAIACAGEFATPNRRLLGKLRSIILSGCTPASYLAIDAVGRWYDRTSDESYRDFLVHVKDQVGSDSEIGYMIDFTLSEELPQYIIDKIERLICMGGDKGADS